jgi:hypothetical protein
VTQAHPGHVEHRSGRAGWQQPNADAKIGDTRHPVMVTPAQVVGE